MEIKYITETEKIPENKLSFYTGKLTNVTEKTAKLFLKACQNTKNELALTLRSTDKSYKEWMVRELSKKFSNNNPIYIQIIN